jgi:protein-tyrosine-phosphatase
MMDWVPDQVGADVPDPYYGELNDFELVYEMVLPACEKLLDECERTVRIIA